MDDRILINSGPSERGWHRLQLMLLCPQLYAYSQILKLDLGDRTALVRGSLIHVGLAHFYAQMRAVQRGEDPGRYYNPLDAMALVAPTWGKMGADLLLPAQLLVTEYCQKHAVDSVRYKIMQVEEKVAGMMGGKWLITQRWDLLVQDRTGTLWLIDHKSSARPGAGVINRYSMSGQFLIAHKIGQATYGSKWGGVYINLIGTGTESKFVRTQLNPAPAAWSQLSDRLAEAEERIEELAKSGRDPWEYPKAYHEHACMTAYGVCPGYSLCQYGKSALSSNLVGVTKVVYTK